jgi:RNA polymerase sigma factor (sigma-70 family)
MRTNGSSIDVFGQLASLRRYARSLTRNETDAEDLVQDALVRAYERRSAFRPGGNLRGWLMSILHNAFIDKTRSSRAEQRRLDALADLSEEAVEAPQEHATRLAQVREHFNALPDEQRAAIHLVAVEGLTYAEAADALDIPVGTLMSRLGRARAALRAFEDGSAKHPPHLRIVGTKP